MFAGFSPGTDDAIRDVVGVPPPTHTFFTCRHYVGTSDIASGIQPWKKNEKRRGNGKKYKCLNIWAGY